MTAKETMDERMKALKREGTRNLASFMRQGDDALTKYLLNN
jgi:hypothetical protein